MQYIILKILKDCFYYIYPEQTKNPIQMKNIKLLSLALFVSLLCSCGSEPKEPTFEEKASEAIAKHLSADSVSDFQILDTLTVSTLDTLKSQVEKSKMIADSQVVRLPKSIEATKLRIEEAQKNKDEATSSLFADSYDMILEQENETLASFETTLQNAKELKEACEENLRFIETAKSKAEGDIAYLKTKVTVGDETKYFALTPKLEILKELE